MTNNWRNKELKYFLTKILYKPVNKNRYFRTQFEIEPGIDVSSMQSKDYVYVETAKNDLKSLFFHLFSIN